MPIQIGIFYFLYLHHWQYIIILLAGVPSMGCDYPAYASEYNLVARFGARFTITTKNTLPTHWVRRVVKY